MRLRTALTHVVLALWLATGLPTADLPELRLGSRGGGDCGCPATCTCRAVTGCCSCSAAGSDHHLRHPCECGRRHRGATTSSPDVLPAVAPRPPAPATGPRLAEHRAPIRSWRLPRRLDRPPRTGLRPLSALEA